MSDDRRRVALAGDWHANARRAVAANARRAVAANARRAVAANARWAVAAIEHAKDLDADGTTFERNLHLLDLPLPPE